MNRIGRRVAVLMVGCIVLACLTGAYRMLRHDLTGPAQAIDGDTIRVGRIKIRLNGVDAEELSEPNGPAARDAMILLIGGGDVRCDLNGEASYDRRVGVCFNSAGEDVGAELIRLGKALDCARYSGGRYRGIEPVGARRRLAQKSYCRP